ncbi:PREDICTED: exonuclease 1 [Nanorana parkeri]|uniref:exonuclease 1 n=1 Tax=Nanorana parkeri TaxID=125878 RepID=UPI000854AF07|nr:PREDICTED: exonuclease 1 [Nanorana parkeri]
MGIQGLLQFLKEASEPVHVNQYKGQTVAVDTYCWLHKGAFACAEKLARGEPTEQYVAYCMKFVHMLLSHGVKPILVFDGCTLPSKKDVERARREKRQANLQKGKQLLREGKLSEARDCFTRSVNITSEMAHQVIKAARSEGVDCIVAPYEADSQLAYLNKNGFAQAIITEDSDLLAFGCKKVFLKMDQYGNGLEIDQARFGKCKQLGDIFTEEKFRYMCILSGCDYLQSIHGVGLVKASKVLKVANNPDIIQVIKKMGQYLKSNITVPDGYIDGFIRANNTFLYQLVFDPLKRKLVPLNPYEDGIDPKELSYAGPNVGDSMAYQISLGNVDVNTMKKIDDYNPDVPQVTKKKSHSWNKKVSVSGSIWQENFSPCTNIKLEEKPKVEEKASRRGLIIPSNKNPMKRSLEGGVSESDLLSQYYFSQNKKPKKESEDHLTELQASPPSNVLQPLDDRANTKAFQPKARNTFATLLQRRNEQSGSASVTGTRSRFFCSESELVTSSPIDHIKPTDYTANSSGTPCEVIQEMEIPEERNEPCKEELTPSPVSDHCDVKSNADSPLRNARNCFSWSGSLAKRIPTSESPRPSILSLRRFQRTKSSIVPGTDHLDMDQTPNSNGDQTNGVIIQKSTMSVLEIDDSSSEDMDKSLASSPEFSMKDSPTHQTAYPERKSIPKMKVPGLLRSKSFDSRSGTKLKPMAPAKASGLSSRMPARAAQNNENKPGVQATISDLWKNFSFKK